MKFAVLLAGGLGTRMKTSVLPKQFIELHGEPILRLTVDKFLSCPQIDHIIVAVPSIWKTHAKDLLRDKRFSEVQICEGGETRQESLYKAVKYIETIYKISDDDIVISHDVSRPFVSLRVIEENIEAMKIFDAVDTVIPATDTIVRSNDQITVFEVPERKFMYRRTDTSNI